VIKEWSRARQKNISCYNLKRIQWPILERTYGKNKKEKYMFLAEQLLFGSEAHVDKKELERCNNLVRPLKIKDIIDD